VRDLLQHPGLRTGDSREAERAHRRPGQKNVEILDGNGDLAKLSGFVASYEKYVETFTQYPIPLNEFSLRNPAGAELSCSGLGILIPPAASGAGWLFPGTTERIYGTRQAEIQVSLQPIQATVLGFGKIM